MTRRTQIVLGSLALLLGAARVTYAIQQAEDRRRFDRMLNSVRQAAEAAEAPRKLDDLSWMTPEQRARVDEILRQVQGSPAKP
jgi:hypothetical protein